MVPPQSLRVVSWNANGISSKIIETTDFLIQHDVDVLLLQETHLRPCNPLKFPNYTVYRSDRLVGRGGGTAIAIRNSLPHSLPDPQIILSQAEATSIFIPNTHFQHLQLSSVYLAPTRDFCNLDFLNLSNQPFPVLLAGDLNSKHQVWGCRATNTKGRSLHEFCESQHLDVIAPTEPTHFSQYRPDILDIALYKLLPSPPQISVIPELSSDHNPILLELDFSPLISHPRTSKRINWTLYPKYLDLPKVYPLKITDDVDASIAAITKSLQTAIENSTKTYSVTPHSPNLPAHLKVLIRSKNRARKRARRTLDPVDKRIANRLCQEVKEQLAEHRETSWRNFTYELDDRDHTNLYKLTKRLRNKRPTPTLQPLHGPRGLVYSDVEKAETFALAMELQFSPNDHLEDPDTEVLVSNTDPHLLPPSPIAFISPREITTLMPLLKTKTAPGPDNIPYKALKLLPPRGIAILTNIFNSCLRLSYFPSSWRHSHIIMIPKPGKPPNFPDSYRPISLLSCLGKLFERLLLTRLSRQVTSLLPPEQFGFRAGLGTELQALRLVEYIREGFQHRDHCATVFLDVSKAFDRVWHEGLIYKLCQLQIPKYLVLTLQSYLSNRTFSVSHNSFLSPSFPITAGVPQGSILSPILYNIYTYDIPIPPHCFIGMYADDTAIAVRSRNLQNAANHLQEVLDTLESYFSSWKIALNPQKSQATLFTKRRTLPPQRLFLYDLPIPWSHTSVYLGIRLDKSLTWKSHITYVKQKANRARRYLYPLLSSTSSLSLRTKRRLYLTILRPIITYGSVVWATAAKTHLKSLESLQSKTLRIITNSPWYIRNISLRRDLEIPPLEDRIKTLAKKTLCSAIIHPNPLLRQAMNYDPTLIRRPPRPRQLLT